ncbi:uncharacterized protein LOC144770935 isoform X2 [Lissotriton helveticus]
MDVRAGPSRQVSRKPRVSFQDVAAYFSKEDWKLLHEWQTELYETVIKEIHLALTTLGPLIATAVFSLRPKETEEVLNLDQEDSKTRDESRCPSSAASRLESGGWEALPKHGDTITNSDVSFRNPRTGKLEMKETEDLDQWGNQYYPNEGFPFPNSDIALREEQAFESNLKDNRAPEVRERSIGSTADIHVIIKEEETYSRDLQESEQREDIYMNTEHEAITQIVPCTFKKDGTAHSMEHKDSGTRGSIYAPTNDRVFKRKMNYKESDKCTKKALLMGKVKRKGFQRSQKETGMVAKMFPGSNQELAEEKSTPCGSVFVKDTYTNLYPGMVKEVTLERYNECESEAHNTALMYPQDGRKFSSSNCEQNISHVEDLEKLDGGSGIGDVSSLSNQCAVYNKTFDQLESQIALERTLSVDRPYVCVKCYKRFRNMWKLTRHQATHSKEKPYICAECGKNYNRSDSLLRHQKSHTERLIGPCEMWPTNVYEHQTWAVSGHTLEANVQSSASKG